MVGMCRKEQDLATSEGYLLRFNIDSTGERSKKKTIIKIVQTLTLLLCIKFLVIIFYIYVHMYMYKRRA